MENRKSVAGKNSRAGSSGKAEPEKIRLNRFIANSGVMFKKGC